MTRWISVEVEGYGSVRIQLHCGPVSDQGQIKLFNIVKYFNIICDFSENNNCILIKKKHIFY